MYEHMCIYRRCAACSELRNVRVSVHCGVHAIVRNVLKHVQVVREDVDADHEVQGDNSTVRLLLSAFTPVAALLFS